MCVCLSVCLCKTKRWEIVTVELINLNTKDSFQIIGVQFREVPLHFFSVKSNVWLVSELRSCVKVEAAVQGSRPY